MNELVFFIQFCYMETLNLPDFSNILRFNESEKTIFDGFRKKKLVLTPEEWVRQNFLMHMVHYLGFPEGLLSVEMAIELNGLKRRCDIVGFDRNGNAKLIVECKSTSVKIDQKTFTQIATYNLKLKVDYLIITNGLNHYCCKMDYRNNSYSFLEELPLFKDLC